MVFSQETLWEITRILLKQGNRRMQDAVTTVSPVSNLSAQEPGFALIAALIKQAIDGESWVTHLSGSAV